MEETTNTAETKQEPLTMESLMDIWENQRIVPMIWKPTGETVYVTPKMEVSEQDELVLYQYSQGITLKETLTPEQVRNLFVAYIEQASKEAGHLLVFGDRNMETEPPRNPYKRLLDAHELVRQAIEVQFPGMHITSIRGNTRTEWATMVRGENTPVLHIPVRQDFTFRVEAQSSPFVTAKRLTCDVRIERDGRIVVERKTEEERYR